MSYPWREAAHYTTGRKGDKIEAIVIHMAEGGGTVEWIANPKSDNSSHYVVRYSGQIVQMVKEQDSAWSLKPAGGVRTDNDKPYSYLGETIVYGAVHTKKYLGADYKDPNTQVIAMEVEGYAQDGPNAAQRAAIAALVKDIRDRNGALPTLAHRDFQNYKACPGKKVPWVDYGGHAVKTAKTPGAVKPPAPKPPEGDVMESFAAPLVPTVIPVDKGAWLYTHSDYSADAKNVQVDPGRAMPLIGTVPGGYIVSYVNSSGTNTGKTYWVKSADVGAPAPVPPPKPVPDPTVQKRLDVANERIRRAAVDLGATPGAPI